MGRPDKDEKTLLNGNRLFREQMLAQDPDFFKNLATGQTPEYLWIGCADSRVPPATVTHADPGDLFVHRNVANLCIHTDLNLLTVLQYAVEYLHVEHIIVCGHYGCGGVAAALTRKDFGQINNWLRHLKDVYVAHKDELEAIEDFGQRVDRLVELNVIHQVRNISETNLVQRAWRRGQTLTIHGWVYDLKTGELRDMKEDVAGPENVDPAYVLVD